MKTTSKILYTLLGLILIASTTMLLSNTVTYEKKSGLSGNDSIKITAVPSKAKTEPVSLPAAEFSVSQFDEPEYWVHYLDSTIAPELEQTVTPSGVLEEMENNPTWLIDYLNKEIH